jgi:serralysin
MAFSDVFNLPMICACCGKPFFNHLESTKVEIGNTPTTVIATPYSGDYRIDVLIEGRSISWNPTGNKSTPIPVTYSFALTPAYLSGDNAQGFAAFTAAQKEGVRSFLNLASSILNINFTEVTESVSSTTPYGQIRMANVKTNAAGYAQLPGSNGGPEDGDVFISTSTIDSTYALGSFDYDTLIHEVAHAIGLKHPGNYNAGSAPSSEPGNYLANSEDSKLISVVSYVEHPQELQRIDFGPYDLLALDYLYGLRSYKADNTSYVYTDSVGRQLQTIYDTGGMDTIDFSQVTTPTTINLNGGLSSSAGKISSNPASERAQNNIQIAFGTEIERVIGSPQADQITGNGSANSFTGGGGNDTINGGAGIDTAIYSGTASQYQITTGTQAAVVDKTTGRDGTDSLTNVERLKFSDTNVALDVGPTQNAGSVYMLYKAAFNRPSDAGGMGYWLAQKDSGKDIVTNLAQGFVASKEFTDKYGTNPTNASYVDKLYLNVLGRPGEAGGVAYWNQELDAGRISKAAVLVQFATLPEGASLVANEISSGIIYQEWVG